MKKIKFTEKGWIRKEGKGSGKKYDALTADNKEDSQELAEMRKDMKESIGSGIKNVTIEWNDGSMTELNMKSLFLYLATLDWNRALFAGHTGEDVRDWFKSE